MKADFHYHGIIGFLDFWKNLQGYKNKNVVEEIIKSSTKKRIGMFAIISEFENIPKGSLHDRFNYLIETYSKGMDTQKYSIEKMGEKDIVAILRDKEKDKEIFMLNGQTVVVKDDEKRYDHLVIGTNQIPNGRNLEDTLKIARDRGVIQIAEHLSAEGHLGIGIENVRKYKEYFDAIEGSNAQFRLGKILSKFPILSGYSRRINENSIEGAIELGKPWVATSDGHTIKSIGNGSIEFDSNLLDLSDEEKLLESLKEIIIGEKDGKSLFKNNCGYENLFSWFKTAARFEYGKRCKEHWREIEEKSRQV